LRNAGFLVAIVALVAIGAWVGFDEARAGTLRFVWPIAIPTVGLAIVGVLRARSDGVLADWFRVKSGDFARGFAAAFLLFLASYAFSKVATPPTSAHAAWLARLYLQLGDPAMLRKHVSTVVAILVVMAVAEEIVWRGLVTSLLEEWIGTRRAWVWAAVLYATAHVPTMWRLAEPAVGPNPVLVIAALGCGLVWGAMRFLFGRLLPSIFSHILFGWTVLMMFRLWGPSV
jgi:uncharacterized protein